MLYRMLTLAYEELGCDHNPRADDKVHIVCGAPSPTAPAQLIDILFILALPIQLSDAELADIRRMPWDNIGSALAKSETLEQCYIDFKSTTGSLVKMEPGRGTITLPKEWVIIYHTIVHNMAELYKQGKLIIRINYHPARRPEAPPISFWGKPQESPSADSKSPVDSLSARNDAQ